MVNRDLYKTIFINILHDFYSDPLLRTALGFKGGTAALIFYNLPRFSVELDFDSLIPDKKNAVFKNFKKILEKYGTLDDFSDKRYTLFFLLNYKNGERNLKVEISKRPTRSTYIVKIFLGISMLVMKEEDMAAEKLSALLTRKHFAARDVFDLCFFF